ncbi:pathogen-related protein [Selaginella moellendorffii]|nr:pathogen-related protein [Selaginella moellendorffii]|eukprot:XP_002981834.2 pathogen-related protein [Selaginella moellendorffii]
MKMAAKDPYRSHIHGDAEKTTYWRHGEPPCYDNRAFEEGRRKVWPSGSLEEIVQNLVKTWEMEMSHKCHVEDVKTVDHQLFTLAVNGRTSKPVDEVVRTGTYNILLQSEAPCAYYDSSKENFESSHHTFHHAFNNKFPWEVLQVYSGPPVVVFKWRHWGRMKGEFRGHAATGELVEIIGVAVATVNSELKLTSVEVYFDQEQFLKKLCKGKKSSLEDVNANAVT